MAKFGELPPSGSIDQRIREILNGGYNYWSVRPLSVYQPLAKLKKAIQARIRMEHCGLSAGMVKAGKEPGARQALLSAYRLIIDDEAESKNQAVGGRSHLRHTFKSMPVGGAFVFKDAHKFTSMAQGPWVKVSARKYRHDSDTAGKWIYTVGSVNALVEYV